MTIIEEVANKEEITPIELLDEMKEIFEESEIIFDIIQKHTMADVKAKIKNIFSGKD